MNQKEKITDHNSARPRRAGERSMGRAGNWEIISTDYGVVLNKLDSGCWYGTPGFHVEDLASLKECVDSAIETHLELLATDAIDQMVEMGLVEEEEVNGETHIRLTDKGERSIEGKPPTSSAFDNEERFRRNGNRSCPTCGDKLGAASNQQCCINAIVRNIVDDGIENQISEGKEPCMSDEAVTDDIARRVDADILIAKGMTEEELNPEGGGE